MSFGTIKLVVIGLLVAAIIGYIGFLKLEVNHYKTKAEDIEAQFALVIHTQAAKLAATEAEVKQQDAARQQQAISAQQAIDKINLTNSERIKALNEELRKVRISADARRVFNDTGSSSGPDQKDSTGSPNAKDDATGPTLADLLNANEVNKKNYLECKQDKDAWIKLWTETEGNLNGTTTSRSD